MRHGIGTPEAITLHPPPKARNKPCELIAGIHTAHEIWILKKAKSMHDTSYEAASQYPWRATREQALPTSWQPSGYGEGGWNKTGGPLWTDFAQTCDHK